MPTILILDDELSIADKVQTPFDDQSDGIVRQARPVLQQCGHCAEDPAVIHPLWHRWLDDVCSAWCTQSPSTTWPAG